jgi:cytochrome c oxidase assembly factor CtaG
LAHAQAIGSRWLVWVAVALVVQTVALWTWHVPGPYEAALGSEWVHGLEHVSFLAAAMLFWWTVVGARRRSRYGIGVVAVFVMALQGTLLGVFMTFARTPWYPSYAGPAHVGLTPLQDQQVAGVIMWGPGGALYLVAALALFVAWLGGQEERVPAAAPALAGAAPVGR